MKTLSIIIPVYNEEQTLYNLIQKILQLDLNIVKYKKQLILVNDGSTDKSEKIIKDIIKQTPNIDIKYIKNKKNSGKGFSLKEGFKHATGDVMIIQDADLEYFPEKDYIPMLKFFESNNADIVYGSRTLGTKKFGNNYSSKSFLRGGLLVSFITSILSFQKVTDEPTCYKMYKKTLKKYLILPKENGFEREPAVTMLLLRKGFSYYEVPIHYKARKFEEGKKIKRQDGVKALRTLLKWRFKKIN